MITVLLKAEHKRLLPVVILSLLVLGHHFYRVHQHDLSMWKGGGMGMFSTQDAPGTRVVRIRLETADQVFAPVTDAIGNPLLQYRSMPTRYHLTQLCQHLARQNWRMDNTLRSVRLNDDSLRTTAQAVITEGDGELEIQAIHIDAWKVNVTLPEGTVERMPLGSARWQASDREGCHVDA